jgi:hypothetical protein
VEWWAAAKCHRTPPNLSRVAPHWNSKDQHLLLTNPDQQPAVLAHLFLAEPQLRQPLPNRSALASPSTQQHQQRPPLLNNPPRFHPHRLTPLLPSSSLLLNNSHSLLLNNNHSLLLPSNRLMEPQLFPSKAPLSAQPPLDINMF